MSDTPAPRMNIKVEPVNPWCSAAVTKRWAAADGEIELQPYFDAQVTWGSFRTYAEAEQEAQAIACQVSKGQP